MASITARMEDALERTLGAARRTTSTPGRRTRTTVALGRVLGLLVLVTFFTGLYSHVLQSPPPGLTLPTRPAGLYQVTQGVHVLAGLAMVPVLLGKLWSVYPRLFTWPPLRGPLSLLERASIAVLVSTSVLEVAIGVMNIAQWYVFDFSFRRVHFALALVMFGSLLVHIGVKLPIIAAFWRDRPVVDTPEPRVVAPETWPDQLEPDPEAPQTRTEQLSRRGALVAVGAAAGAIVVATAGQSVPALAPVAVLAPRRVGLGPQGLPVNRTAKEAGVLDTATSPDWTLELASRSAVARLTLADLNALPQVSVDLPIACVEGWSQWATWSGIRLRDLMALVGAPPEATLALTSLQTRGAFARTTMPPEYVADPTTLVALRLFGETLDLDHGYPARVIAPGRPGVLQTKWLSKIEVTR